MKDIQGYEGLYAVTEDGKVWSHIKPNHRGTRWMTAVKISGYLYVFLRKGGSGKYVRIHRIVAQAYIPNEENKYSVNHIDGNKFNNKVENLEWLTTLENNRHAWKIGLAKTRGEKHPNARFTGKEILKIRNLRKSGVKRTEVAKMFHANKNYISSICMGRSWKHLPL